MNISINAFCAGDFYYKNQYVPTSTNLKHYNDNYVKYATPVSNYTNLNSSRYKNNFYNYNIAFMQAASSSNLKKICNVFLRNGTLSRDELLTKTKELQQLAKCDLQNVLNKYEAITNYLRTKKIFKNSEKFKEAIKFDNIKNILLADRITLDDLYELISLKDSRPMSNWVPDLILNKFIQMMLDYERFEDLPASKQIDMMQVHKYVVPTEQTLSDYELQAVKDDYGITRFDYIRDLRTSKSKEDFIQLMDARRINIPCNAISVNTDNLLELISPNFLEGFINEIKNVDLTKYETGFPLKYTRKSFIEDFSKITEDLPVAQRKRIFKFFEFNINTDYDIINYPNPESRRRIKLEDIGPEIEQGQKFVNRFMSNNSVIIDEQDKGFELYVNKILNTFPELYSIIGKAQHRNGSIDFHTFDVIQKIVNNPEFENLDFKEKRILILSALFHDFAKEEGKVDENHAKKCALSAKEIIKKLQISYDEKERIYNLIRHSHWLTDSDSDIMLGFYFRRPNDFKMAQIFSRADSNSSGFEYNPSAYRISSIVSNINKINTDGILIFADNIPLDASKFDKNVHGVKYLDFRDPEASVEKYGFPAGTKVKDVRFFCHCTITSLRDLLTICDDSKDVCLSTMLLDRDANFNTTYSNHAYIVTGNNANVIIGGKNTFGTGERRGLDYAKEGMYKSSNHIYFRDGNVTEERKRVPNFIRERLNLSQSEYLDLYERICNFDELSQIDDLKLYNGRVIKKEDLSNVIREMHSILVSKGQNGAKNEFVIYNPKIQAIVVNSSIDGLNSIKQSPLPIILI